MRRPFNRQLLELNKTEYITKLKILEIKEFYSILCPLLVINESIRTYILYML